MTSWLRDIVHRAWYGIDRPATPGSAILGSCGYCGRSIYIQADGASKPAGRFLYTQYDPSGTERPAVCTGCGHASFIFSGSSWLHRDPYPAKCCYCRTEFMTCDEQPYFSWGTRYCRKCFDSLACIEDVQRNEIIIDLWFRDHSRIILDQGDSPLMMEFASQYDMKEWHIKNEHTWILRSGPEFKEYYDVCDKVCPHDGYRHTLVYPDLAYRVNELGEQEHLKIMGYGLVAVVKIPNTFVFKYAFKDLQGQRIYP